MKITYVIEFSPKALKRLLKRYGVSGSISPDAILAGLTSHLRVAFQVCAGISEEVSCGEATIVEKVEP